MQDLRPVVRFVRLVHGAGLPVPAYATPGSAGLDLPSAETVEIPLGGRVLVSTGFRIEIPSGYEGQIRPRSGLAVKHGVTVLNSPGTIDSDYRGEVKVILINLSVGTDKWQEPYKVMRGERIAQLVVAPVSKVLVEETETVRSVSERGEGGFGSTDRGRS